MYFYSIQYKENKMIIIDDVKYNKYFSDAKFNHITSNFDSETFKMLILNKDNVELCQRDVKLICGHFYKIKPCCTIRINVTQLNKIFEVL